MKIHFVAEACPCASAPSRIGAIRSHARRAAYTRTRQERVNEYKRLNSRKNEDGHQQKSTPCPETHQDHVVVESPTTYLDSLRRDPFQCLPFRMNEIEQKLIDYYVTVTARTPSPSCTVIIPVEMYEYLVTTQWVPFALTDDGLLNGLLLQSARRIACSKGHPDAGYYHRLALKYKIACIHLLRTSIAGGQAAPDDTLIARAIALAMDELERKNMATAMSHVRAIGQMVRLRGGIPSLGLEGFLGQLVLLCRFHVGVGLE